MRINKKIMAVAALPAILIWGCNTQESSPPGENESMTQGSLARVAIGKSLSLKTQVEWANLYMKEFNTFKGDKKLRSLISHEENSQTAFMDKFDLYLLTKYGKVIVAGKTVFSVETVNSKLAAKTVVSGEASAESSVETKALAKTAGTTGDPYSYPIFHNHLVSAPPASYQYNMDGYKGYGESWTDNGDFNYTAGGLTQFQKKIKHWYGTTWDDFNANWLSINVNYYNSDFYCLGRDTDLNTNDDYISERRYSSANRGVRTIHQIGHGSHSWLFNTSWGKYTSETCSVN